MEVKNSCEQFWQKEWQEEAEEAMMFQYLAWTHIKKTLVLTSTGDQYMCEWCGCLCYRLKFRLCITVWWCFHKVFKKMYCTHAEVIALYRSCPAVSQIWALTVLPSTLMLRVANSTPIVLLLSRLNSFRVKRDSRLLFPTPESPISTTSGKKERKKKQRKWGNHQQHSQLCTQNSTCKETDCSVI